MLNISWPLRSIIWSTDTYTNFFPFPGEQEYNARNMGTSSIYVFSAIIPLSLIVIVIFYQCIKKKNKEDEEKERLIYIEKRENFRQKCLQEYHKEQSELEREFQDRMVESLQEKPNQFIHGDYVKIQEKDLDAISEIDNNYQSRPDHLSLVNVNYVNMPETTVIIHHNNSNSVEDLPLPDIPQSPKSPTSKIPPQSPKVLNNEAKHVTFLQSDF